MEKRCSLKLTRYPKSNHEERRRGVDKLDAPLLYRTFLRRIHMEKELLEMAVLWKKTALEELARCEPASRSEFANQMLLVCAQMLEDKLKSSGCAT
jgi:hypothetical protein